MSEHSLCLQLLCKLCYRPSPPLGLLASHCEHSRIDIHPNDNFQEHRFPYSGPAMLLIQHRILFKIAIREIALKKHRIMHCAIDQEVPTWKTSRCSSGRFLSKANQYRLLILWHESAMGEKMDTNRNEPLIWRQRNEDEEKWKENNGKSVIVSQWMVPP